MEAERLAELAAERMFAAEWTLEGLRQALETLAAERGFELASVAGRLVTAFAEKPKEAEILARFLQRDELAGPILERARILDLMRVARMGEPPEKLAGIGLPGIVSEGALAAWLGLEPPRLQWLADVGGRNPKHPPGSLRPYRYRWIAKRGRDAGGGRLLEIPKAELKEIQRRILRGILNLLPMHEAVHGFCAGRSIVTNAAQHCGKAVVVHFDLADFFLSVPAGRVFGIFRTLGYPRKVAWMLMGLCTTQTPRDVWQMRPAAEFGGDYLRRQRMFTRHLPQGAPTSPALANFAARRMDLRLCGLAASLGAVYTRYADDLNFSGETDVARPLRGVELRVGAICFEEGFTLNFRKTRLMRRGVRQTVTGVVVNARPNVRREEFERLKAVLTNCARRGPKGRNRAGVADFRAHLAGKVAQLASIHAVRGARLRKIFERIEWGGVAGADG